MPLHQPAFFQGEDLAAYGIDVCFVVGGEDDEFALVPVLQQQLSQKVHTGFIQSRMVSSVAMRRISASSFKFSKPVR